MVNSPLMINPPPYALNPPPHRNSMIDPMMLSKGLPIIIPQGFMSFTMLTNLFKFLGT